MQRRLDDHEGIADLVRDDGRQPAERRQPLLLRHLALKARHRVGQRVERRREQLRVFVVPQVAQRDLARQVAGRRHLAHHAGDRRNRPRDRPRDREADHDRENDRDDRGDDESRPDRLEQPQLLGPRPHDQRHRSRAGRGLRRQRTRQHRVLLAADDHLRDARRPHAPGEGDVVGARQRGREDLSVHAERDVAAGRLLLQLVGERVVEEKTDAHGAENVRPLHSDVQRYRDELHDAVGLRHQHRAFLSAERAAHGRLARGDDRFPIRRSDRRQRVAPLARHDQQIRFDLTLIFVRDVGHRGRVVRVDGGLQARGVSDEARHLRVRLAAAGAQVVHHRRCGRQLAFERPLGLIGDRRVDDVQRDADAEHRQQRAPEKDPAAQRREDRHLIVKSSSASASAIVAGFGSVAVPSCHATTL